ncbi:MAG: ABC transporter permease subunit [Rhizobiales bacterium]|nr:ABC transporter permease subunit [Hyphomicrobiales bacterium]
MTTPTGTAEQPTTSPRSGLWSRGAGHYQSVGEWWILPAAIFLVVFFVVPLVENAEKSIALSQLLRPGTGDGYYLKLFTDPYYLWVIGQTVILSVGVTAICVVVGYPIALYLVRHAGRWSGLVIFLLIAPLLTSIIMRTFGWRVLFARRGLFNETLMDIGWIERPIAFLNGPVPAVIGLVHVLVPFMILSIASVLRNIDIGLEESARLLGAGRIRTFMSVTLPLSLDGIGTGAILVFLLANGSFVTLLLLGGGSIQTLPLLIYQQFNTTRDFGFASAMSNVLLVVALACLYLQLRLIRRRGVKGG